VVKAAGSPWGLRPATVKDSNLILANSRNSFSLDLRSAAMWPPLDRPLGLYPVVQLLHGDSEGFAVEVEHFEDFVRDVRDSRLCHNHLVFGSTRRRIGQQRTIEARFLLSTAILSDSKQKLFCAARIGWSKCGERNAKKPDAFRDWELGSEQIQANPLQCGSFFDYPGQ
jgi:hypothetical protein